MAAPRVRTTVLGAGSWGTALAALACQQSDTVIWARDAAQAQVIDTQHVNPRYLPGTQLPAALQGTPDFDQAIAHVCQPGTPGLIILGVPVSGMAQTCASLARVLSGITTAPPAVIWTCKGFDQASGQLPHEIAEAALGSQALLGVLSGPSFAKEVAQGLPVALTIASPHKTVRDVCTAVLHGKTARIYASTDVIGVEVGGALKNVVAIACGISDGLTLGANARAALITRGLAEIQRMGVAMGGLAETFSGLTGLGDLVLTATGDLSRNRQVGLAIGQGQSLNDILAKGTTAEGVRCVRAALALGRKYGVDLPIAEAVCQVLFEGLAARQAVSDLLAREAKAE